MACSILTLSLNGIPIVTLELKNPLTGQNVEDAKRQYRADRDPREKIFEFKRRTLAHRLASLHNEGNQRVFDSVVVITDRRVLDRQLQDTILSMSALVRTSLEVSFIPQREILPLRCVQGFGSRGVT
jgi:type I site-specific restriction-modification system R (restriction) subunit